MGLLCLLATKARLSPRLDLQFHRFTFLDAVKLVEILRPLRRAHVGRQSADEAFLACLATALGLDIDVFES